MSNDNKNDTFDLLPHEKKISDLYQNIKKQQGEMPSANLDAEILAMAQRQLSENSLVEAKAQECKPLGPNVKNIQLKKKMAWQWPMSLVASVGIMTVLLITHSDYYIHPNNVDVTDSGVVNGPVTQTSKLSAPEKLAFLDKSELLSKTQMTEAIHKEALFVKQNGAPVARKSLSDNQTAKVPKERQLDSAQSEVSFTSPPMSLAEMSKLLEALKGELAAHQQAESEVNGKTIQMQQTLFEQLFHYQESHREGRITNEFLNVLTDEQRKQLQSLTSEAIPEN
ncbi:hypothetical protein [uncultured Paraglaciecola sp.]|uniref:hypothetical protein n=1 Tax=uncultured Paraglaciecola sp. TaxID=1765024 RepID=UPI0030D96911|tara:strand:- start:273841 stop:274683 length:843 start_codon:yes stop_codon:yes gene_type:complete